MQIADSRKQGADDGQIRQDGAKKYMTDGFDNKGFLMVKKGKDGVYNRIIKRILDIVFSFCGIVVLSPLLLILTVCGAVAMKGNPFFVQERPGWHEKIFKLIKFRTMSNEKDVNGDFLPDKDRLTAYGKFLRSTSLDELPQLINILLGDMSFVGPRPWFVKYLPLYSKEQHHRHDVKPGLTGLAQVSGRNFLNWSDRIVCDLEYVREVSFALDISIILKSVSVVFHRAGISSKTSETMEEFKGNV